MIADSISHPSSIPWAIAIAWLTYVTTRVIYHLYFSPLAKFPGPKLAAVTRWYEFYYDVVQDGSYIFKIQKLHEQYGPIIRVTPYELHVNDPEFFDTLYSIRGRRDKYEWAASRFGVPDAFFSTPDHELHRMRRAPMQSMFSKQKIIEFEPYLQEKLNILYRVLRDEYSDSNKVLRLDRAASAFSGDVVSEYAFGKSFNTLESKDFLESLHDAFLAAVQTGAISLQFPWLPGLLKSLPTHWTLKLQPQLAQLFHVEKVVSQLVEDVRRGKLEEYKTTAHPTIFHELLDSDLPESEKSPERLRQEAQSLIGAGFSTTAWTVCVGCVYILSDPAIEQKLRSELRQAIPIASEPPKWVELEQLPYLKGCVYESIRLSYGAVARLQRIAPDQTLYYKQWAIPPGTPVSQSHFIINHNETVFPDSYSFRPERWIDFGTKMEKYVYSFSKGTRRCIGVNLATAEAFMLMAMLFRRVNMRLFETDRTNVECIHDWFIPGIKKDSKGIQVKVGSVE